jgi:nitrate reductase NapE component
MMPLSEKLLAFAIVKHLVIFLIPELSLGTVANGYGFIIILA